MYTRMCMSTQLVLLAVVLVKAQICSRHCYPCHGVRVLTLMFLSVSRVWKNVQVIFMKHCVVDIWTVIGRSLPPLGLILLFSGDVQPFSISVIYVNICKSI